MQRSLFSIVVAVVLVLIITKICWTSYQSDLMDDRVRLSPRVINGVKSFVLFVCNSRSGHSIIGSLMDAHPHVVIAHEYFLFSMFPKLNQIRDQTWKGHLFNELSQQNVEDPLGRRSESKKGYTLEVNNIWQGKFDEYIEVIGDKSGGKTMREYRNNSEEFKRNFLKLQQELSMPIRVIHAVRNPFDVIAAKVNYFHSNVSEYVKLKHALQTVPLSSLPKLKVSDEKVMDIIRRVFAEVHAVAEMIEEVFGRENVLEVHNCDLVSYTKGTLSRIFQFIEVDTTEEFLDMCAAKVFKSVSRSRDTIEWSPQLIEMVKTKMKKYEMFNRYSFTSD